MQVVNWISKQAGKLADNFNEHKFYVKNSPETLDSSTVLSLSVFDSREELAIVPCVFRWYRIRNGLVCDAEEFRGNVFLCEPSDVGCMLQVEVTSTDPQFPGTALLKYGPVQIDPLLKQTIESALSTGEGRFNLDLEHRESNRQCALTVAEDYMMIAHSNSNACLRFFYNISEPLFSIHPQDITRVGVVFSQKFEVETLKFLLDVFGDISLSKEENCNQELRVALKFLNRRSRDQFLFTMKGFNAKKELKHMSAITKIEKLEVNDSNINFVLEVQSLRNDLVKMYCINKKQQQEKDIYIEETCKLEHEIEDIISSYTKLIEGKFKTKEEFETSFIEFETRKDKAIANKYAKIEEQNSRLKQFIRENLDQRPEQEKNQANVIQNPFIKKKQPFAQLANRGKHDNILQNMSLEDEMLLDDNNEWAIEKQRLNQSLQRGNLQESDEHSLKNNKSAQLISNEVNKSMSRHNMSALQISTSRVIQEKAAIEKKYKHLKEDYRKLKYTYQSKIKQKNSNEKINQVSQDSFLLTKVHENPQFRQQANKEIAKLREVIAQIEREREAAKLKADFLALQLRREKTEHDKTKQKLEKKLIQLNEEVNITRKSNDALNRSQHLSMEMDDYNDKQNEILKEQVAFLEKENERLENLCFKYKEEYKKLKSSLKESV